MCFVILKVGGKMERRKKGQVAKEEETGLNVEDEDSFEPYLICATHLLSLSLSLSRSSSLLLSEMVPSIFRNAKACSKTRKSKVRGSTSNRTMVDADFKLKELKRAHKDLELKGKGYRKRLEELQTAICKHLEQYRKKVSFYNERVEELNSVTQERDDIKKQYDEWRKKRC